MPQPPENEPDHDAGSDIDLRNFFAAFESDDPHEISHILIKELVLNSQADKGTLYFLDLFFGKYLKYTEYEQYKHTPPDTDELDSEFLFTLAYNNCKSNVITKDRAILIRIRRCGTTIGIVHLRFSQDRHIGIINSNSYAEIANAFIYSYTLRYSQTLTESLKEPIEYQDVEKEPYFEELIATLTLSSGIEKIVIRELGENGALECICVTGFSGGSLTDFSFDGNNLPTPFADAIEHKTVQFIKNAQGLEFFKTTPLYSSVQSFVVVPVIVGSAIFGTISYCLPITYNFTTYELSSLEAITNAAGVSIANFQNYKEAAAAFDNLGELSLSMSAVDVSQAVRHEAIGLLGRLQTKIASMLRKMKDVDAQKALNELSNTVNQVTMSINKIKLATKPPEKDLAHKSIKSVWDETCDLLHGGRLRPAGIKSDFQGQDIKIDMYTDWLRTTFFNLLLNSHDAYKDRRGTGERYVLLKIVSITEDRVILEYTDNAGGIDTSKLRLPGKFRRQNRSNIDLNRILFEPGVTSKGQEGGGYGLYLARRGIQIHATLGSLDLLPSRGGIKLQIVLPITIQSGSVPG